MMVLECDVRRGNGSQDPTDVLITRVHKMLSWDGPVLFCLSQLSAGPHVNQEVVDVTPCIYLLWVTLSRTLLFGHTVFTSSMPFPLPVSVAFDIIEAAPLQAR